MMIRIEMICLHGLFVCLGTSGYISDIPISRCIDELRSVSGDVVFQFQRVCGFTIKSQMIHHEPILDL